MEFFTIKKKCMFQSWISNLKKIQEIINALETYKMSSNKMISWKFINFYNHFTTYIEGIVWKKHKKACGNTMTLTT